MSPQEIEELLSRTNHAIIAVNRAGSSPQVTPVWYLWDGAVFYVSTSKDRAKYTNIVRDPEIALMVDNTEGPGYVAAYGRAEILAQDDPEFAGLTRRLIGKYMAPDKMDRMLEMALGPDRILVRLKPDKIVAGG